MVRQRNVIHCTTCTYSWILCKNR